IIFFYGDYENHVLMDLLNLKYVISYANRSYGLRGSYLPRAFIVPRAKTLPKKEILDHLIAPDFDPRKVVLLESDAPPSGPSGKISQVGQPPGKATITSYRPDEIVINTDSQASGFLFLSEAFYPGWKAYLNDKPVKILRGNYLFRVIQVPQGRHVVRFVFDPVSIKVGACITILTIFLIVIAVSRHAIKSRKPQR
ncbi:MAG: YfhO family protein, partial [Deltaproteobacteria bacterium]|nr:YfhO family protein [Deltaproteobacteria bacterium]